MKKGWKYKKIKDVGEVIGGTTPSTTNPEFWGGDICWISPAELHGEHYLYDSIKKITAKAVSAKSLKELPVGTVILSSRAPIGKIAINKVPMYCNQGFKCVVCGPELYNEFLYWWLYGKVDYLNSLGTGATFKEISKTVVENIVVPIPPLDEQQLIVSRLDVAFAHIDELKANAEKQSSEARALFQKALTKAMDPKEGWEEKELGNIVCFFSGYAFESKGYTNNNDDVLLICGDNIVHCDFRWDTIKHWPKEEYEDLKRFSLEENDIVLAMDRPWVKSGLKIAKVSLKELPSLLIQRTACIRASKDVSPDFIFYSLQTEKYIKHLVSQQTGVGVPHISGKQILSYKFSIPNYNVQQRIVSRLDSLSAHVRELEEVLQKTIAECDALKQALLRQVFE